MAQGWGQVPLDQWDKYKQGNRQDVVDPGDYVGSPSEMRELDPAKHKDGLGTIIVSFNLTDENAPEFVGKRVDFQCKFHPDPSKTGGKAEGYAKMNDISMGNLVELVEAAGMEPVMAPNGMADIPASVQALCALQVKVIGSISHRVYEGKTFQDFEQFRPMVTA